MRDPNVKVAHPSAGYEPLTVEEKRREGHRDREVDRVKGMGKDAAIRPRRKEQTFAARDFIRMGVETPIPEAKRQGYL